MKKITFFFFAMLAGVAASAQSHINIQMLGATYTGTPTVKFRVSWSSVPTITGQTHNAKIWVWIDYRKIENNQPTGTWTRAEITTTPAVSSSPTSTATLEAGNNKGFWLNGVTGSYSATLTASLTNIPANTKFNWCAYTSDCPPNVSASNGTYTFKGTPPFTLIAANGTTTQTVSGKTLTVSALTMTPTTIRDRTECPGVFCIYTGSDLYIDATHLCQQRTSGAKNWEAYIKDSRDNGIYRIVLMPDNKWWLAQNVKYAGTGSTISISGCTPEICGRFYSSTQFNGTYGGSSGSGANKQGVCPNGWFLPINSNWTTLFNSISATTSVVNQRLRALNSSCSPRDDYYGWANKIRVCYQSAAGAYNDHWWSNETSRYMQRMDSWSNIGDRCNYSEQFNTGGSTQWGGLAVRCFRQL